MNTRIHVALLLLAAFGLCTLGLIRVHDRYQVIRVGYKLSEARSEFRELQEEQSRLRLEESFLASPERIEKLAFSLGMIRPTPDQLRIIPLNRPVALRSKSKAKPNSQPR